MRFHFKDRKLAELFTTGQGMNLHPDVVKIFSRTVQQIVSASDMRDIRVVKGKRFEKLKGDREGQYSMRLSDQFRLILEMEEDEIGTL